MYNFFPENHHIISIANTLRSVGQRVTENSQSVNRLSSSLGDLTRRTEVFEASSADVDDLRS